MMFGCVGTGASNPSAGGVASHVGDAAVPELPPFSRKAWPILLDGAAAASGCGGIVTRDVDASVVRAEVLSAVANQFGGVVLLSRRLVLGGEGGFVPNGCPGGEHVWSFGGASLSTVHGVVCLGAPPLPCGVMSIVRGGKAVGVAVPLVTHAVALCAAPPPVRGLVGVASRRDVASKARVCVDETFRGARGTVLQAVLGCVPPLPWSLPADSGQAAPSTREVPLEEPRAF